MVTRRAFTVLALVMLPLAAACSGGSDDKADEAATTTTEQVTTTTTVATTTVDPTETDAKLIVDFFRALSDSSTEGLSQFFELGAAHSYPPGQITADMLICSEAKRLSQPGSPLTSDGFVTLAEQLDLEYENIVDRATVEPAPDWTIPNDGGPGSGTKPEGRVYVFSITTSTSESAQASTYESHATVLDGEVYWFPEVPEECLA